MARCGLGLRSSTATAKLSGELRRCEPDAIAEARRAIDLDPAAFTGRWGLVWALAASGRDADALEAAEPALRMSGRGSRILAEVAASHSRLGDRAAAEQIFQEISARAQTSYVGWAEQGAIAASAGRLDEARRLVRLGIEARDSFLAFPTLSRVESVPRRSGREPDAR